VEAALVEYDSKWQSYFQENSISPFVVYYEDLAADYPRMLLGVLKWLGVPNPESVVVPPSRLKRQSDARNEEWLARYLTSKSESGDLAPSSASVGSASPLFQRMREPFNRIPNGWKQWVAQSKLRKAKDDEIVEVLVSNCYSRAAALAEVQRAGSDPYVLGAALTQRRLSKGASLLNAIGQLARLDSKTNSVDRRTNLSRDEFRDRYYAANRPVVIQGLTARWRAMTAWTPDYLKSVAGDRMIEVMTGRDADPKYEINGRKHRTEMRFTDYIDMVFSGKVTNDYYMVANNGFLQRPEAQPLLQSPPFRNI
jgi:hypothetical protein